MDDEKIVENIMFIKEKIVEISTTLDVGIIKRIQALEDKQEKHEKSQAEKMKIFLTALIPLVIKTLYDIITVG